MSEAEQRVVLHPSGATLSTLPQAFPETAALQPDALALRTVGKRQLLTWCEYGERVRRVRRIAAGLAALGVERGQRVGLMLRNRPEFHLADMAIMPPGAIPFSIYNTSAPARARDMITAAIRAGSSKLSRVEQIKRFVIVGTPWEPGGDELTPTMKLKRRPIAEKYSAEIDKLYAETPGPAVVSVSG